MRLTREDLRVLHQIAETPTRIDARRANLTVQSVANPENDSPATILAKKNRSPGIIYKGVKPNFFVVSSARNARI